METKEGRITFQGKEYHCPVEFFIDVLSGKWKLLIIRELMEGTKRFSELHKAIPGITQKMLTKQLRELERAGIIKRKVYPQVPPKVEYSLTDTGKELKRVFDAIQEWGVKYLKCE
ncbi:helix-turn-helix domain-containing protein [Aquifex pyrophilus]